MGKHLVPRNKNIDTFSFGEFSFSWMMDSGVGLIIETASAMRPGTFYYTSDKKGRCPRYEDGFYVTAEQARAMAMAARGLVKAKRWINEEWEKLTPEERERYEEANDSHRMYNTPVRKDFIEKVEQFADWAEQSWGFGIW